MKRYDVVIDKRYCKGCEFCVIFCKRGALEMTGDLSPRGYLLPRLVNPEKCNGCGLCVTMCTDFSIKVYRFIEDEEGETA